MNIPEKRILAVMEDERSFSGPSIVTLRLFSEILGRKKADAMFIIPDSEELRRKCEEHGFSYVVNPYGFTRARESLAPGLAGKRRRDKYAWIERKAIEYQPTLIHCSVHQLGPLLEPLVRRRTSPMIVHFHSSHKFPGCSPYLVPFRRLFRLHGVHAVSVSDWIRGNMIRLGIPAERVTTIYTGIDLSALEGAVAAGPDVMAALGIRPGEAIVGLAAHLRPEKGVDHFIRAVSTCSSKTGRKIAGVIVGRYFNPEYEKSCRELASRLSSDHVRFVFAGYHSPPFGIMKHFGVSVLPSRFDDPFPTVAVESLALGLPTVAYARGGLVEILSGRAGWLVPQDDIDALAKAIAEALESPEKVARAIDNGREKVRSTYHIGETTNRYLKLADRLIAEMQGAC